MLSKKEFLEEASKLWEEIVSSKSESDNLYDYEKALDDLLVRFGRSTLEGSLGKLPKDRRKKKNY